MWRMTFVKTLSLLLIVIIPWHLRAQMPSDTDSPDANKNPKHESYFELGYSGATIFHPGITGSFSKPVAFKKNENKNSLSELLLGVQAGIYYHHNMQTGVYAGGTGKWIKTSPKGFQYGFDVQLGYLRAFIPQVYEITSSGEIRRLPFAGTNHFELFPSFRLGHRFKDESFISAWYVKNGLMMVMPYPGNAASQYFLEAGIVKRLN